MTHNPTVRRSHGGDEGIAMVLSLLFMLLLSALGTAMLILSRSETISSVNYRMMSQARYGAESGIHKAANYLTTTYILPGTLTDPLAAYDMAESPVRYLGLPVVLSSLTDVLSNYPLLGVKSGFASATEGTLPVGDATVHYKAAAALMSMRIVIPYGSILPAVVQTWRLTSRGWIEGAREAQVEVSAVIERQVVASTVYGMFATNIGCGALTVTGGVQTDSYDSNNLTIASGLPITDLWGGDVGTNGNMTESGTGTIVRGSLSTPRSGVGNCKDGAITALDQNGNAEVTSGVNKLSQAVEYPLPDLPSPTPPSNTVTVNGGTTCLTVVQTGGLCTSPILGIGVLTLDALGGTMTLGNVRVTAGATLAFKAGTYNINTMKLTGNSIIKIASAPVVFNISGTDDATPLDMVGGSVTNASFKSKDFRILYAGTGTLKLTGGTTTAASVYAPKAAIDMAGGAHFFGSVVGATVALSGGMKFHRDRDLLNQFFTLGPQMMSLFTWKEY